MPHVPVLKVLAELGAPTAGVFRAELASTHGVTRNQLARLRASGLIERVHPSTYRLTTSTPTPRQRLTAALLWAGDRAAAAGRSAGALYDLEGVRQDEPEIVVPHDVRARNENIAVSHADPSSQMIRRVRGLRVTGIEPTMVRLAHLLDAEPFEIACEDARRRKLTSVPALHAYLARFGGRGRPGVATLRSLLDQLDPQWPSRSTLEVKTRRLLIEHGFTDFVREFPLAGNGRRYHYDFAFVQQRTILETNGRRWHDDPTDYERDNAKWSVPAMHGFRLVLATWERITAHPDDFLAELGQAIAA